MSILSAYPVYLAPLSKSKSTLYFTSPPHTNPILLFDFTSPLLSQIIPITPSLHTNVLLRSKSTPQPASSSAPAAAPSAASPASSPAASANTASKTPPSPSSSFAPKTSVKRSAQNASLTPPVRATTTFSTTPPPVLLAAAWEPSVLLAGGKRVRGRRRRWRGRLG